MNAHNHYQYKKKNHPKLSQIHVLKCLQLWDFFLGTQERVRSSRGKQAISGQAIEVLLYLTAPGYHNPGPEVIKRFSCSTQLSMKF